VSGLSRTVTFTRRGHDAVVAHAREAAPDECCGLLLGRKDAIVEAIRARNIAADPGSGFVIDPADHFGAIRTARARSLEIVGFYHSHPRSAPAPSPRDLAEFNYPDHFYVIVSVRTTPAEVGLFHFASGTFQPVSFVTI
jgi:proteasome lid subunit RPN8/RPN11